MSVEATFATTNFMGDNYTFVDCPGSIEFIQDMRSVLPAVDAAVVVLRSGREEGTATTTDPARVEDQNIPRFVFLNKIDKADRRVRETIKLLQPALACAPVAAADSDLNGGHYIRVCRFSRSSAPLSTKNMRRPKSWS